jgi:hypothetical protein
VARLQGRHLDRDDRWAAGGIRGEGGEMATGGGSGSAVRHVETARRMGAHLKICDPYFIELH